MRFISSFFLLCFASLLFAQSDEKKLEQALFDLPNVSFQKISKPGQLPLQYGIRITQPIDHQDVSMGYFRQRLILTHSGFEQPTVMETQGYELSNGENEIAKAFSANHLNVEHRFFGESVPESTPWKYLTLEQETADLHDINQLFRRLYNSNKWISTGISKGGQTTIFYKYFYPNDVDVWIPYVAPFNNSLEDKRIYTFLDTIGSPECRKSILDFQHFLLANEDKALEKLSWYTKGAGLNFSYLDQSLGKAFEYCVLEFSFSFWQWGGNCADIPTDQSLDNYLDYLLKISDIGFFSDRDMKKYAPHYYQAATQMGYYGYNIEPFKGEIKQFTSNPSATFAPKTAGPTVYDNSLNKKVSEWLTKNGDNMLYIYGANDTWSADRIIPSSKVNAKSFVLPGKDHGRARIKYMEKPMQEEVKQTLSNWMGVVPAF